MQGDDDVRSVVAVRAAVALQSASEKRQMADRFNESLADDPERRREVVDNILDPGRYQMYASLSAMLSDGSEIATGTRDMGFSGPKDGLGAIVHRYRGPELSDDPDEQTRMLMETYHVSYTDVVDHVNQMLGRDPELHRPPRLAWRNLIKTLENAGIQMTEEDLITVPLELDLSVEVKEEIRAS